MAEKSINADIRVLLQDCLKSSGDTSCVLEMIIEFFSRNMALIISLSGTGI